MILKNKGFTLIEMAIVLIILGILLGIGASLIGPLTKRAKYTETKEMINANVESIIGYAAINNCLPDQSLWKNVVRNSKDSWNKEFLYISANEISGSNCSKDAGICERRTASLTVVRCSDSSCSSQISINDVAFVMISGGLNYNIQTSVDSNGKIKVYEPGTNNVDDYNNDFTRPESYDDIVKWVTLPELKIKIGCTGNSLKILNTELPTGYQNQTYSATLYAEGGIPYASGGKYDWCLDGTLPAGITTTATSCTNGWTQADNVSLSGTPSSYGTFFLTFKVKDTDGNEAEKSFVLTINPAATSSTGCSTMTIKNVTGSFLRYKISGSSGWNSYPDNASVTIGQADSIRFKRFSNTCGPYTISDLTSYDTNSNCKVNLTDPPPGCNFSDD